jgi:phosphohistidine phosphatase
MRHATARSHGESDHARELTRRGVAEANEVARRLAAAGVRPALALVSSALRARQTWEAVERECGPCEVRADESLYSASADTVLEVLRLVPVATGTVAFVGHNPAAEYMAGVLSGGDGDPEAMRVLLRGMPPATAAVFGITADWSDLAPGGGRLLQVFQPSSQG